MARKSTSAKKTNFTGIVIAIVVLALIVLAVFWLTRDCASSSSSHNITSEPYEHEFRGKCSNSYRLYDDANIDLPAGRDRCRVVCDYDFSQYEYYPNCAHNARQYGVSLCDQGKIL
jgi:hypothetical protein